MAAETDDDGRLAALHACAVMDTAREPAFDNTVFTAAQLFRVRIAALVLVDDERVWAKAKVGPFPTECRRDQSLCTQVVDTGQVVIVEDASIDARFQNLLGLGPEDPIRFFAGAPVLGPNGLVLGALAVFDRQPRTVAERQLMQLMQLARQAGELLRMRIPTVDLTV